MKSNYLLPNSLKIPGWILFSISIICGIIWLLLNNQPPDFLTINIFAIASDGMFGPASFLSSKQNNILDEIIGLLLIVGSIFIAFSKEKKEDEFIARIRLESLVWAIYVNYSILAFAIIFIYDMPFAWVLEFNLFTPLIFFIIRYNWALYKLNRSAKNEE